MSRELSNQAHKASILESNVDSKILLQEAKDAILFALNRPYQAEEFSLNPGLAYSSGNRGNVWDVLSPNWKKDRDIAAMGFKAGVPSYKLPDCFRGDRKFLLQGVSVNSNAWYNLPDQLKTDPIFPRSFRKFSDENLVFAVFERLPFLRQERDMWLKIFESNSFKLGHVASTMTPPHILCDRELMIKACFYDDSFFSHVHESLHHDRDFVQSVLAFQPSVLSRLPRQVQLLFPELVAAAIPSFFKRFGIVADQGLELDPEVMEHHLVKNAWFSSGGPFVPDIFPQSWRDDAQIFLWIAEYRACAVHANDSFKYASDRLKNDKDFMLEAVEKSPAVFSNASFALRSDFDLILVAFAGSRDFFEDYMGQAIESNPALAQAYLAHFATIVQQKLEAHDAFFHSVLCGTSRFCGPDCVMKILDQGPETSMVYKKLIGDFLGLPTGKELHRLRTASRSFSGWL